MNIIYIAVFVVLAVLLIVMIVKISALKNTIEKISRDSAGAASSAAAAAGETSEIRKEVKDSRVETIQYINSAFGSFGDMVAGNQKEAMQMQDRRLAELSARFAHMSLENEQKLENIRTTVSGKIGELTADNNKQLTLMRQTVDEKLQKTLEDRIGQSFQLVSQRLEQVYKGLGEMQTLASGVGEFEKGFIQCKNQRNFGRNPAGCNFRTGFVT